MSLLSEFYTVGPNIQTELALCEHQTEFTV